MKFLKTFLGAQNTAASLPAESHHCRPLWCGSGRKGVPRKAELPVPSEGTVPGERSFLTGVPHIPRALHLSSIYLSQRGFPSCALHEVEHPRRRRIHGSCHSRDLTSHSPLQPSKPLPRSNLSVQPPGTPKTEKVRNSALKMSTANKVPPLHLEIGHEGSYKGFICPVLEPPQCWQLPLKLPEP